MAENVFIVENKKMKLRDMRNWPKLKAKIRSVIKIKAVVTGGSRVGRLGDS